MINNDDFFNELIKIKAISTEFKPKPMIKKMLEKNPETQNKLIEYTKFLPIDTEYRIRFYFLYNNILAHPVCQTCGGLVPLNQFPFIPLSCSKQCIDWDSRNTKSKKTNIEKYGVDNPLKNAEVKKKKDDTMIEKYGTISPIQNKEIHDKMKRTNIERYGHENTCSLPNVQDKRKKTNLERYGHINPLQNKDVKEKSKQTMVQKYGVEYPMQSPEIEEKITQTMIELYGVEYPMQNEELKRTIQRTNLARYGCLSPLQNREVKEKCKQTMLEKYGVEETHQSKELMDKAKQTNIERYGEEFSLQNKSIWNKTKQTMIERYGKYGLQNESIRTKTEHTNLEKYGVTHPLLSSLIREKGKQTNLERYGNEVFTKSHISDETYEKLNNYDWMCNQHKKLKKPLIQIATELNISSGLVSKTMQKHGIPVSYYINSSQSERDINSFINELSVRTIANTRSIIPPYELDIYIPTHNFAIEFNGIFWHGEQQGKDQHYHLNKTNMCVQQGIELIHIFENEWELKQDIVKSYLKLALNLNEKIDAKNCTIVGLAHNESKIFFDENHIQGSTNCKFTYGLVYDNQLVAAMSFGKSRFDENYQFELLRYACKLEMDVDDGSLKLFEHFVNVHYPKSIVMNIDKRFQMEKEHNSLGFFHSHDVSPNYFYFTKNNQAELLKKSKFQHHTLKHKLETFDPNLSEYENMVNNGYDRIWDCGTSVWVWKQ